MNFLYILCLTNAFSNQNNLRYLNRIRNNQFKKNIKPIYSSHNNNTSLQNDELQPDIIERYSDWFGWFPKEQKWKSVRFTFYSIAAGYMLAESFQSLNDFLTHKPIEDFFDK